MVSAFVGATNYRINLFPANHGIPRSSSALHPLYFGDVEIVIMVFHNYLVVLGIAIVPYLSWRELLQLIPLGVEVVALQFPACSLTGIDASIADAHVAVDEDSVRMLGIDATEAAVS